MEGIDLDLLPDAVVVVDAAGAVVASNQRAASLLGVTADDHGRPLPEVLTLHTLAGRPCDLPLAREGRTSRSPEHDLVVVHRGGLRREVAAVVQWHPDGAVLSARPAARRRARERASSEVIAMVSHEIRSPLTSVKGFTRTLLQRWERFTDEQKRVMLATIDHDADRVTRLLRDLLEVSRIDTGRVQLQRAPLDLGAVAMQAVERTARRDPDAARRLHLEVAADLPRVDGDADRLAQVLHNLLDNALREAPAGPIEVSVGPVVHADAPLQVELVVRDHGPGVPEALARTIFGKFARGRNVHRVGMGLGLYLSRGLVEAHGGTITLDPSVGEGASFRVRLPAVP